MKKLSDKRAGGIAYAIAKRLEMDHLTYVTSETLILLLVCDGFKAGKGMENAIEKIDYQLTLQGFHVRYQHN